MVQANPIRVLIVDDHPVVREGLATMLGNLDDFEICGVASSADEAFNLINESPPDIVSLDLRLEGKSGLDFLRTAREKFPKLKVLIVSMCDELLYADRCIQAGARGFINKNAPKDAIVKALKQVAGGEIFVSEAYSESRYCAGTPDVPPVTSSVESLSNRELQIFELFADGGTVKEIADTLFLSAKTVESHRDNIKEKLGLTSSRELMRYATLWRVRS